MVASQAGTNESIRSASAIGTGWPVGSGSVMCSAVRDARANGQHRNRTFAASPTRRPTPLPRPRNRADCAYSTRSVTRPTRGPAPGSRRPRTGRRRSPDMCPPKELERGLDRVGGALRRVEVERMVDVCQNDRHVEPTRPRPSRRGWRRRPASRRGTRPSAPCRHEVRRIGRRRAGPGLQPRGRLRRDAPECCRSESRGSTPPLTISCQDCPRLRRYPRTCGDYLVDNRLTRVRRKGQEGWR